MAALQDTLLSIGATLRSIVGADTKKGGDGGLFAAVKQAYDDTADAREKTQKLRDFHAGDQITGKGVNSSERYVPQWPDETDDEFDTRVERMEILKWNRVRDGVWTHADALYSWGAGGGVGRELVWRGEGDENAEIIDKVRRYLELRVWNVNSIQRFMWEVWECAGSESDAVVFLQWLNGKGRRLRPFEPGASASDMGKYGVPWFEILDNMACIKVPDERQARELGSLIRWYHDPSESRRLANTEAAMPGYATTITEFITDERWYRWKGSQLVSHQWTDNRNRYGDVRTLFAWAQNMGGVADSVDAIGGQVMLLEHLYNSSEVWRNHAFPDVLFAGFDPATKVVDGEERLMRGPTVAHVAQDSNAKIIKAGLETKLSDVGVAGSDLHQMIDEALGVTGFDRGKGGGLGQVRSAPAIGKMQGSAERRRRRKILAAIGFEQALFRASVDQLAYHAKWSDADREALFAVGLRLTFPADAFASDDYTTAQKDQIELAAGVATREDKMRQRQPDLPQGELENKLAETEEDMTDDVALQPSAADRSKSQEGNTT